MTTFRTVGPLARSPGAGRAVTVLCLVILLALVLASPACGERRCRCRETSDCADAGARQVDDTAGPSGDAARPDATVSPRDVARAPADTPVFLPDTFVDAEPGRDGEPETVEVSDVPIDTSLAVDARGDMSSVPRDLSASNCLVSPIECGAEDTPLVNGVPEEPPGVGGCPAGMVAVATYCVDRYEAMLVAVAPDGSVSSWSPYATPDPGGGTGTFRAMSVRGAVPQGYIDQVQAAAACEAAGKRLCTDAEWLRACRGPDDLTYPYGNERDEAACNGSRACHPAIQFFETNAAWIWSELGHPCLNQLPDGLAPAGDFAACVTAEGVYDMVGNLHEWTADPNGAFRGGFYVDTMINGAGCLYRTTAHNVWHWDYSTGFRCCAARPQGMNAQDSDGR